MLEGLLTWNWKAWYQINALLGLTIVVILAMFGLSDMAEPVRMYSMIYAALWVMNILFDNTV